MGTSNTVSVAASARPARAEGEVVTADLPPPSSAPALDWSLFQQVSGAAEPLRILIDGYFFDRPYGFGRYVRELAHALHRTPTGMAVTLLVPRTAEALARSLAARIGIVSRRPRPFPIWEQFVVPAVARRQGCDLVHFPYQSTALLWPSAGTVVTIHDLMFLRAADTSASWMDMVAHRYRQALFRLHTRRAAKLISVSDATQRELEAHAGASSSVVVSSAELFVESHAAVAPETGFGRYFLHRGGAPHKNTDRIVEAVARLRADFPDVTLVVYGTADRTLAARYGEACGVVVVGKVPDARLAALFKGAVAVVAPSLEEGFGLATIEAFGFGTPVVTSDRSPMREVAGGAAALVDPTSTDNLAAVMRLMLTDAPRRDRLRHLGEARYRGFVSAADYARNIAAAYRSAAQQATADARAA